MSSTALSEALNSTEVGSLISRHLGLVVALVVALILGIFGFGIYSYQKSRSNQVHAETVYRFSETELPKLVAGESSTSEFMMKLEGIKEEVGNFSGLAALAVQVSDEMSKRGQWEEALKALKMVSAQKKNPYIHFFIATREAAVYEDLGQYEQAVGALEALRSNPVKLMEDKIYLDLGRLYARLDQKEKARLSFEHVTKNMAQSEFATLAKLYLSQL